MVKIGTIGSPVENCHDSTNFILYFTNLSPCNSKPGSFSYCLTMIFGTPNFKKSPQKNALQIKS